MSNVKSSVINADGFILDAICLMLAVDSLVEQCHVANFKAGWWSDLQTGEPLSRNVPELLMLAVSELAEAMEGDRKNLQDDKLPQYKMLHVELADAIIRICDLAGALSAPLGEILAAKMQYNASRLDHTLAHRASEHGKKF